MCTVGDFAVQQVEKQRCVSPPEAVPAVAPLSCGGASPSRCFAGPLWREAQRGFVSAGCSGSAIRPETDEPLAVSPPGWSGAAAAEGT